MFSRRTHQEKKKPSQESWLSWLVKLLLRMLIYFMKGNTFSSVRSQTYSNSSLGLFLWHGKYYTILPTALARTRVSEQQELFIWFFGYFIKEFSTLALLYPTFYCSSFSLLSLPLSLSLLLLLVSHLMYVCLVYERKQTICSLLAEES